MIKALFFDIDGTLISNQNLRITPRLKEAFDALRVKKILLCIATRRHYQEIKALQIAVDYPLDGYITLNGCYFTTIKKAFIKPR